MERTLKRYNMAPWWVCLASVIFSFSVFADGSSPTSGALTIFPGNGMSALGDATEKNVSTPVGWNIPGRFFTSGDDWWVLDCASVCRITSAKLFVREGFHPDYDGPDLPSQLLSWSSVGGENIGRSGQLPLLLFKANAGSKLQFKAGPVPTLLHAGMGSYPEGDRPGRMETEIDLGMGGKARVVPRMLHTSNGRQPEGTTRGHTEDHATTLVFELRAYGRRQRLGTYSWDIEGARVLDGTEYVRWAGDLDRDGKLDLLMSYASRGWSMVLYLSSLSAPDQIVGEAGQFVFWPPNDPGC